MNHYCLIDGNNIAFASQLAAMDAKSRAKRLYAGTQETTAINGVLQASRDIQKMYHEAKLLMLWDSGKAWRYSIYPEYKGNRKANPTIVAAKEALATQREFFMPMGDMTGVRQVTAENFEADDIAAYLSEVLSRGGHKVTLITRDQDWLQLVNHNVSWLDKTTERFVNHITFEAETGFKTPAEFSESKILKGDAGDNVFGIKGVGEKAAENLISVFGTADKFLEGWEEWAVDNLVTGHPLRRARKPIADFLANKDAARELINLNRNLMDLRIMFRNDDLRRAIKQTPGIINKAALLPQLQQLAFLKIAGNLDEWIAPFVRENK